VEDPDVRLRGVTRRYGDTTAVEDVDLELRRGEFFSLLGPSGCGKSTLLRLISGFETPDAGTIELGGRDTAGVPPHRRDVNLVFQDYALFPHLDVGDNVAFGLRRAGADRIPDRVAEALAQVGLAGFERRRPDTLSGGERQRVALARAVVPRPRVLLLDEPLSALDLQLRLGLREELRRLQRALGMTFLLVTHDQEEALALSDRLAVLHGGRVRQVGTPRGIYDRPADRLVAAFVGTAAFFDGRGDGRSVRTDDGLVLDVAAEGPVTVMLRPEAIRLADAGLPATVEEVHYRGATSRLWVAAGKRRIAVDAVDPGLRPGDRVHLAWSPDAPRILPR
jgi:ABC-type Fe3+/spermidine/putrescine transport system ATPase subunit